jgi:hypothetical protein
VAQAVVFATQAQAQTAQKRFLTTWAAQFADWLDADGNIVGANAATELPAVRRARTTDWCVPQQRVDTNEWWVPAPPRFVLAAWRTQLQSIGARLDDVAPSWFADPGPL